VSTQALWSTPGSYANYDYSPQGVGMGRKPQVWLKDGDVVEVSLEGIGTCINKVEFLKEKFKL